VSSRLQTRIIDEFATWATAQGIAPDGQAGRRWYDRITILLQAGSYLAAGGRSAFPDGSSFNRSSGSWGQLR
jgi:hypothetical protein